MTKLILKRDDIALYKNGKTILDGFNEIRANLNEKVLRQYVEQYIDPTGVKDFNRFLRHFAILSSYLLRRIKSSSIVYQDLLRDYSFECSRIEIHRYLNRVYESIKHI